MGIGSPPRPIPRSSPTIETKYGGDLVEAVRVALNEVRGAYAIGVMHTDHPDRIVGARMNVPLIVGLGDGGLPRQRRAGDPRAHEERRDPPRGRHRRRHTGRDADPVARRRRAEREVTEIHWAIEAAEKGGFAHFTLKEIYEQPHAIQEALRGRVGPTGA